MEAHLIVALVVFLFPLAYSPGPGNSFFAAIGATRGARAAISPLIGYHAATLAVTILIGMGFGLVLFTQPAVVRLLSVAGSAYVFWIAWCFLREASRTAAPSDAAPTARSDVGFMSGALVLLLNPKAYLIIGLLFSQFLTATDDRLAQVVGISAIFTINNLIAFAVWTLAGASLSRVLGGGGSGRGVNLVFALCLAGVAVWMLLPAFHA